MQEAVDLQMDKPIKISRKEQILQTLAHMLETAPKERITTARLAKEVGVSEAALYRHFPSKAKMFEGLIEFIENSVFTTITRILSEEEDGVRRLEQVLRLLLGFCEHNPGLARILGGDALAGETDRLRGRVVQFFERLETQLRQILKEAELSQKLRTRMPQGMTANLLLAAAEGRIAQFVRSEFKRKPTENWQDQWDCLSNVVFY